MAVITPDFKSQQMTNIASPPLTYLRPNELGGRVRCAFFYFAPATGNDVAATKVVSLTKLPAGARILSGKIVSNGAVTNATVALGLAAADGSGVPDANTSDYDAGNGQSVLTADSGTFFGSGITIATAGSYSFADTYANNNGYMLQKECYLIATFATAGMTGGTHVLQGHVLYVVD